MPSLRLLPPHHRWPSAPLKWEASHCCATLKQRGLTSGASALPSGGFLSHSLNPTPQWEGFQANGRESFHLARHGG